MTLATEFQAAAKDTIAGPAEMAKKPAFTVKAEALVAALTGARRVGFDHLACLTAVDWPKDGLIDVWYNLYSYRAKEHLALRVRLPREAPEVDSAAALWKGADWYEREVWDLFGVRFRGHPDLRRILLPEGWTGHPLRKDYDRTKQQYVNLAEAGEDTVSFEEREGW